MPPLLFQPLSHLEFSQRPWERGKDYISPQVIGTQRRQVTLPQKELGLGSGLSAPGPGLLPLLPLVQERGERAGGQEAAAEVRCGLLDWSPERPLASTGEGEKGKAGGRTMSEGIGGLPSCILGSWAWLQLETQGLEKRAPYPLPSCNPHLWRSIGGPSTFEGTLCLQSDLILHMS